MKDRQRIRVKAPSQSAVPPIQVKSLQSRPFAPTPNPATQQQSAPSIQAQLDGAKRFGYDLSNISVFPSASAAAVQPKLTVGQPGDKYEQEADQTATDVVNWMNTSNTAAVQRQPENQVKPLNVSTNSSNGIQRKMMTRSELEALADVKGALLIPTTKYERIVKKVEKYEHIDEKDTEKRLAILDEIESLIKAWQASKDKKKKQTTKDSSKRIALRKLRDSIYDEKKLTENNGIKNKDNNLESKVKDNVQQLSFSKTEKSINIDEKSKLIEENQNFKENEGMQIYFQKTLNNLPTLNYYKLYSLSDFKDQAIKQILEKLKNESMKYDEEILSLKKNGAKEIDNLIKDDKVKDFIEITKVNLNSIEKLSDNYLQKIEGLINEENTDLLKRIFGNKNRKKEIIKSLNNNKIDIELFKNSITACRYQTPENIQFAAQERINFLKDFKEKKKKIKEGVKTLDPDVAKLIKNTNKGIKEGKEVKSPSKSGASGSYLVPEGFFKPMSQSASSEGWRMKQGYQTIREVLAYELSKYMEENFGMNLGIGKASIASLKSEQFAQEIPSSTSPNANVPEQVGSWHERIDIEIAGNIGLDKELTLTADQKKQLELDVQKIAFFDLMTGNYDRHSLNLVVDKQGKLRPIDQGEILPNLTLYKNRSTFNKDNNLSWSRLQAAKAQFSKEFQEIANKINPEEIINHLQGKVKEIEKFAPEITKEMITDESWELMRLHIIALKEGVKAGLSPKELQSIFVGAAQSNQGNDGEVLKVFLALEEARKTQEEDGKEGELTKEDFRKAENSVLMAIKNGIKRTQQEKQ